MSTLRDRLKANIAWSQGDARRVIGSRVQVSEADIDAKAKQKLTAANSFDYILKEVLFIGGNASSARREANQYRKSFTGCDSAVELSLSYTDAAVRDIGRRHATQFPDALAGELAKLNVGGITKPRVVEGGVSMLAVCAKETSEDTTYIANGIRQRNRRQGHEGRSRQVSGRTQGQGPDRQGIVMSELAPIAISMGEPAGIGPDLILRLYERAGGTRSSAVHRLRQPGVPRGPGPPARAQSSISRRRPSSGPSASSPSPCRCITSMASCPTSRATRARSRARS